MSLPSFIAAATSGDFQKWDFGSALQLSSLAVPDEITKPHSSVLRADVSALWTRWFIESFVDPADYIGKDVVYPYLFSVVLNQVKHLYPNDPSDEQAGLASQLAKLLLVEISTRKQQCKRGTFSKKLKKTLIEISSGTPRCWICGLPFQEAIIDRFVFGHQKSISWPLYLDILRPHGLKLRDYTIEVDHVYPHASGGVDDIDNLALACGWCNQYKSNYLSLYDVPASVRRPHVPCAFSSLPEPFWSVRLMGVRKRCLHVSGCSATSKTHRLFIVPIRMEGALNPANLTVVCELHDPIENLRLHSRKDAALIWGISDQRPH